MSTGLVIGKYTRQLLMENNYYFKFRNANDGNTANTDATQCTHTADDPNADVQPWWIVDMEQSYYISHVMVTNRACHAECGEQSHCA